MRKIFLTWREDMIGSSIFTHGKNSVYPTLTQSVKLLSEYTGVTHKTKI